MPRKKLEFNERKGNCVGGKCSTNLQVASIGNTLEHIDEPSGLPQRPIIEASFGATNIPYDTLIDSGADVNVMPYALF